MVVGIGDGSGAGLVGLGLGWGLVGLGLGRGLVGLGLGRGLVLVGLGLGRGLVLVGLGLGRGLVLVGLGLGRGLVLVGLGVGVGLVLVGLGVGVGVVVVAVGLGVGDAQAGTVMTSSSRVTAPLRASARPMILSPVFTEIEVRARMLPWNDECVPSVAELPTCQKTLHACAPPVRTTELAEPVISVEPIWKIKTAFGSPCASRVSAPLRFSDDEAVYTPGVSVCPAPLAGPTMPDELRPAASTYAVVRSDCAPPATPSAAWMAPDTIPGGNPVTAVPGLTPRSPPMKVAPVFVTVVPARTPKLLAVPRFTVATAAPATDCVAMMTAAAVASTRHAIRPE
jgi:hypothetical protein